MKEKMLLKLLLSLVSQYIQKIDIHEGNIDVYVKTEMPEQAKSVDIIINDGERRFAVKFYKNMIRLIPDLQSYPEIVKYLKEMVKNDKDKANRQNFNSWTAGDRKNRADEISD